MSIAKYNMERVNFSPDLIDAACDTYFISAQKKDFGTNVQVRNDRARGRAGTKDSRTHPLRIEAEVASDGGGRCHLLPRLRASAHAPHLTDRLKAEAQRLGFALSGIAPATEADGFAPSALARPRLRRLKCPTCTPRANSAPSPRQHSLRNRSQHFRSW